MVRTDSAAQVEIFGFRDSAFTNNRELPAHRWIPWIAGFSAQFVEDSIAKYLSPATKRACVLDPFAGVGTTLVAGYLRGLNVVGFEINPYAALASKVKLEAAQIDPGLLQASISAFQKFMNQSLSIIRNRHVISDNSILLRRTILRACSASLRLSVVSSAFPAYTISSFRYRA